MAGKRNRYPGVYRRGKTWSYRAQFHDGGSRWGVSGSGYATAAEAWEARNEALKAARPMRMRGGKPDNSLTLGEYLKAWLKDHVRTVRPATAWAYEWRVEQILKHPMADKRLRTLTEPHYRRLIQDLKADSPTHSTLLAKVGVLSTALNAAVRAGLIPENPVSRIRISRTQEKFVAQTWDVETARKFLAHRKAAGDPLHHVWHLALVTGMRKGELHGLKWDDIDLDAGLLHVRRQRTQVRGEIIEQPPKTEGSEAPVFLDSETVELLRSVRPSCSCENCPEYVVVNPKTGRPYDHLSTFRTHWRQACEAAGVPVIRFHDLRHTTASLMADAGVPLIAAKERLRHWSTAMTARYTHATNAQGRLVADRLGKVLGSGSETPESPDSGSESPESPAA